MSLDSLPEFLDYLVLGEPFPGDSVRTFPGVRRRTPALVEGPPEFEPLPHAGELNDTDVPADEFETEFGRLAPAARRAAKRGIYRDVCALERVDVSVRGASLELRAVWCSSYPAPVLESGADPQVRVFPLEGDGQPALVVAELMERIRQFLGSEALDREWEVEIERVPFEDLA